MKLYTSVVLGVGFANCRWRLAYSIFLACAFLCLQKWSCLHARVTRSSSPFAATTLPSDPLVAALPCSDGYKQGSSGGTISVRTISSGGPSTGGDIAIPAADVEICRRPDGKEFMLGQGGDFLFCQTTLATLH